MEGLKENIMQEIASAEHVLVGIGEEFDDKEVTAQLGKLAEILAGKNYFVLSTVHGKAVRSGQWREGRLVDFQDPDEEHYMKQWNLYTKWLGGTLNHKLVLLELGVGLKCPDAIRWPFEKVTSFNQKAILIRINEELSQLPLELKDKGMSVAKNAIDWLTEI